MNKVVKSGRLQQLYPNKKPQVWQKEMQDAMRAVGYDWSKPPENPTVQQLKTFVGEMNRQLNPISRLSKAISITDAKKKELRKEIMAKGYKTRNGKVIPLQYYAH